MENIIHKKDNWISSLKIKYPVLFTVVVFDFWPPVTTNECLKCLGIRDATCVVHYDFPTSPKVFGSRLFCMADNFRNFSGRVRQTDDEHDASNHIFLCDECINWTTVSASTAKRCWDDFCGFFSKVSSQNQTENCSPVIRSMLLISEKNARHVVGVLRYLGRTNAPLPPELLSFAQSVQLVREDQKTDRPLCSYLKSFGVCRSAFTPQVMINWEDEPAGLNSPELKHSLN